MPFWIKKEYIFFKNNFNSKKELFTFIAEQSVFLGIALSTEDILSSLQAREDIGSTIIADNIAMPHARSETISQLSVLIITNNQSISYNSEENAQLFFVLLSPINLNNEFIKYLTKIASVCLDEDILTLIKQENKNILFQKLQLIK